VAWEKVSLRKATVLSYLPKFFVVAWLFLKDICKIGYVSVSVRKIQRMNVGRMEKIRWLERDFGKMSK